jgi:hypothetical protein
MLVLWLLAGCSAHKPHSSQRTAEPVPAVAVAVPADTARSRDPWKSSDPSIIVETYRRMTYIRDCNKNGVDDDEDIDRHVEDDINENRIPDTCDPQDDVARFVGPGDDAIPDSSMLVVRYTPPDLIIFRYFVPRSSRVVLSIESDWGTRVLLDRDHDRGWMEWPWVPMLTGKSLTSEGRCSVVAVIGSSRHSRAVAWSYSKK